MPCTDGGPSYEQIQEEKEFHNAMTRLSCEYCKAIERGDVKDVKSVPKWAKKWWKNHQDSDVKREREEKENREWTKKRKAALAKLTDEEKGYLDISW